jgi:hypothetical protein
VQSKNIRETLDQLELGGDLAALFGDRLLGPLRVGQYSHVNSRERSSYDSS